MPKHYKQLCIWTGCLVKDSDDGIDGFVAFMKKELKARVTHVTEFKTKRGHGGPGGRNDVLFSIHGADISKFATRRFNYQGIRWWSDYLVDSREIVPKKILNEYA